MGIYYIINKKNQKIYIGSAINFENRFKRHLNDLKKNIHHCIHLQRSWNKYGEGFFVFGIIELVNDKKKLLEREQFYIDYFSETNFNTCKTAGNCLGVKHSDETKLKRSLTLTGRKHSNNTKRLIGELAKARVSKSHMDYIRKLSAEKSKFKISIEEAKKVIFRNENGETMINISKDYNVSVKTLRKSLKEHLGVFAAKKIYVRPFCLNFSTIEKKPKKVLSEKTKIALIKQRDSLILRNKNKIWTDEERRKIGESTKRAAAIRKKLAEENTTGSI